MVPKSHLSLHSSRPPTFWYFLQDALLLLGLPYGPQARERLASEHPDLFGRSFATLRGYERWVERNGGNDTLEAFAQYMDGRYKRWVGVAA
jgi:hypothetical protein